MSRTIIQFCLDASGSMLSLKASTIEAFNAYWEELRSADPVWSGVGEPEMLATVRKFEGGVSVPMVTNVAPANVPPLSASNYHPDGGTPLLDTAMDAILDAEASALPGDKVVVIIQTDGQENASRRYKLADLTRTIEQKKEAGWQFNFMGAGLDAYAQAHSLGLSSHDTMSVNLDDRGNTISAYAATARRTRLYASGQVTNSHYTNEDRLSAGDTTTVPPIPPDPTKAPKTP